MFLFTPHTVFRWKNCGKNEYHPTRVTHDASPYKTPYKTCWLHLSSIAVHPTQHVIDTKISHQHRQESQYDIDMQEYWTAKRWQWLFVERHGVNQHCYQCPCFFGVPPQYRPHETFAHTAPVNIPTANKNRAGYNIMRLISVNRLSEDFARQAWTPWGQDQLPWARKGERTVCVCQVAMRWQACKAPWTAWSRSHSTRACVLPHIPSAQSPQVGNKRTGQATRSRIAWESVVVAYCVTDFLRSWCRIVCLPR